MKTRSLLLSLCTLVVFSTAPMAMARGGKKPVTEPGTYKEWGPDIDELEIVKTFKIADYDRVAVMPFDTSATPLPDPKDRSYDTIKSVLASYNESFTEAFRSELKAPAKVEQASSQPHTAKTLVVRGVVDDMSPGSRAKRYLVGYGAGASGSKIHGEIIDAKSGNVLLKFTQERRSGGTFKFGGGSDAQVMRDSIHAEAQDVAHMLDAFQ